MFAWVLNTPLKVDLEKAIQNLICSMQYLISRKLKILVCVCVCVSVCVCVCVCVCMCVCLHPFTVKTLSVWIIQSTREQIKGIVLKIFLPSAKSLHRYFRMKHQSLSNQPLYPVSITEVSKAITLLVCIPLSKHKVFIYHYQTSPSLLATL